jgi:hypothetical protein
MPQTGVMKISREKCTVSDAFLKSMTLLVSNNQTLIALFVWIQKGVLWRKFEFQIENFESDTNFDFVKSFSEQRE